MKVLLRGFLPLNICGVNKMNQENYECLKLDNQLCFPLYAASREILRLYTPFLSPLDLTYTQYISMMVLWAEKELTVKELGERLYLDSGTLTPLLKKLEQKGYITRVRSKADERSLIVSITSEGERLKERAAEVPAKIGACVHLAPEDAQVLYGLLHKLLREFSEENE